MLLPGELKTQENKWEREPEVSDPAENSKALTFHRAIISDLVDLIRHFIPHHSIEDAAAKRPLVNEEVRNHT